MPLHVSSTRDHNQEVKIKTKLLQNNHIQIKYQNALIVKSNLITELFHVPAKNLSTCTGYFYGTTDF